MAAAHLAGPRAPQPPAGRQLRLGLRRGLRPGLPADARGAGAPSRRSACRSTTPARCSTGSRAERPDFIERLRALVARDQVEILGGGYYEPVLASLPERDRVGQLRRMGDELERLFGRRPTRRVAGRARLGAGPADVAGRRRLRLDDPRRRPLPRGRHPRGGPVGAVHDRGPGPALDVFGTEQGLRYRIPFRDVDGRHRVPARPRHRGRANGSG